MNTPAITILILLLLSACASENEILKTAPTAAPLLTATETRTIELDSKTYQVQWDEYEMDFKAMVQGARGMLSAEKDPWSKVPMPPDTVSTIAGFVLVWTEGKMGLTTEIITWENHDLQFEGSSPNLPHRVQREIPQWRLPSRHLRGFETRAGSRVQIFVKNGVPVLQRSEGSTPPFAEFEDGERYIFCLKHGAAGEVTAWAGDILAIVHLVPTYRIAGPNSVFPISTANLHSFQTIDTSKAANRVVFELSKAGKKFNWWNDGRATAEASGKSVEMLAYALNGIIWEKLPATSEKESKNPAWHYVIQYAEGNLIRSATISPSVDGKEIVLESAELGRWKGEDAGLIAAAFEKL